MGFELDGNHFVKGKERYLPLYEGKMVQNYDHRTADVRVSKDAQQRKGQPEQISIGDHKNPFRYAIPSSWVSLTDCNEAMGGKAYNKWFLGFSSVTSPTNSRSFIPCLIPHSGVGNSFPIFVIEKENIKLASALYAGTSSFILDFNARQKIGGVNLNFFYVKQFPVIPPETYTHPACLLLGKSVTACVLELSYTAYDLQPFAKDCGYDGPPFIWDEERRFEIRCELDALYFHLYLGTQSDWQTQGSKELLSYLPTPRNAVEYIMETFPIVKRKDEKEFGEYRTKIRILEIYNQMTYCLATNTEYRSSLNPPPGPPCDAEGNFIPVEQWDKNNLPKHIHPEIAKYII